MLVSALVEADRPWATALVAEHFGSPTVVSRGALHDARALPGLIAHKHGRRQGLLQYRPVDVQLEIVVLIACRRRQGSGGVCSLRSRSSPGRRGAADYGWSPRTTMHRPLRSIALCAGASAP
jgi:hypothetical protein